MRKNITFSADGNRLTGWLVTPDRAPGPHPLVILSFGFSGLKEMGLDKFADVFTEAGLGCLVYDHRNFGGSEGEPRREIDPWRQVADMRHAISFARSLDGIDPERIGLWGTSYAGGHIIAVSAIDKRVKCAVAQVPFISGFASTTRLVPTYHIDRFRAALDADREARFRGEPPAYVPVALDPEDQVKGEPYKLGLVDAREEGMTWLTAAGEAAGYENSVTLASYDMFQAYEPGALIERVSPTPLLMIVGDHDEVCVTDVQLAAYERAREPKRLELLKSGHYDVYWRAFDPAAAAARDWFVQHLRPDVAASALAQAAE
jgi:uncharacterized protein